MVLIIFLAVCFIVLTILLKLCAKYLYVRLFFMAASSVAIIATSFAMPELDSFDWDWATAQFVSIFAFFIFTIAEVVFEREYYTEVRSMGGGRYAVSNNPISKSKFWSSFGSGAFISLFLVALNYIIFKTHAVALGVVGCLALVLTIVTIVRVVRLILRFKREIKVLSENYSQEHSVDFTEDF